MKEALFYGGEIWPIKKENAPNNGSGNNDIYRFYENQQYRTVQEALTPDKGRRKAT
jgi:hypothetical protein